MIAMVGMLLAACTVSQTIVDRQPSGALLFRDDFSDPNSGWDRVTSQDAETNYSAGAYRIWVNEPYTDLWANPDLKFGDVSLQVEASKLDGPDDNLYGLICRSDQSGEHYYYFVISSDGYYGIGKVSGDNQNLLGSDKLLPHDAIQQGGQMNLLQVACVGDRLTFSVNGQKLAEARDGEYLNGDIGLTAGSFDESGVDIRFDNLLARKP
jgi:hypothetical protein